MQLGCALFGASLSRFLVSPGGVTLAAASQLTLSAGPPSPAESPRAGPQGAARWLHVNSGALVVHAFPPSPENIAAAQQATPARLKAFSGGVRLDCRAGDTALLPVGWHLSKEYVVTTVVTGARSALARTLLAVSRSALAQQHRVAMSCDSDLRPPHGHVAPACPPHNPT